MTQADRARAVRLAVLPDRRVGQVATNPRLRRAWWKVAVADRACVVLGGLDLSAEDLDRLQAAARLVGTLDLGGDLRTADDFHPLGRVWARRVEGFAWDRRWSQQQGLMTEYDAPKLVAGALHVAEVEDVSSLPETSPRRCKVLGDTEPWVRAVLATAGWRGAAVWDQVVKARRRASEPHEKTEGAPR